MVTLATHPLVNRIEPVDPQRLIGDRIQPGHHLFGVIWINPQRVSGTPCFYRTRVPVKTLFDCLVAGQTIEQFLDDFEGVTRDQALAVLNLAADDLLSALDHI